ncbi:MAG: transcriptional repressor [Verrucomicrobia bacterium]|nr:MAG: transcriptional repressor [Verrucomicrobiota bacterium]
MRARTTRQLEVIRTVIQAADRPLTVAELHAEAARELPGLGIATVYRAVRDMARDRMIVAVNYPGQPTRYEAALARHHAHFICHHCKRVFDVEGPEEVPLPRRRPKGFKFTGNEVVYYGSCADCARMGRGKR